MVFIYLEPLLFHNLVSTWNLFCSITWLALEAYFVLQTFLRYETNFSSFQNYISCENSIICLDAGIRRSIFMVDKEPG
jgi:hypothetical protein